MVFTATKAATSPTATTECRCSLQSRRFGRVGARPRYGQDPREESHPRSWSGTADDPTDKQHKPSHQPIHGAPAHHATGPIQVLRADSHNHLARGGQASGTRSTRTSQHHEVATTSSDTTQSSCANGEDHQKAAKTTVYTARRTPGTLGCRNGTSLITCPLGKLHRT